MKKSLCLLLALICLLCACSSGGQNNATEKAPERMHFNFDTIQYSVPDSWVDDTSDPDGYLHTSADGASVVITHAFDNLSLIDYLKADGIDYDPVTYNNYSGAVFTNENGQLQETYEVGSYLVMFYDMPDDEKTAVLDSVVLND